jgi:hypothetical protein
MKNKVELTTGMGPNLLMKGLGFLFFIFISPSTFAASIPFSFTVTSPGTGATVNITASSGLTATPTIATAGTGYLQGEELYVVQTGALGGIVTITSVGSNGAITGLNLSSAGIGYTTASGLSVNGSATTSAGVYTTASSSTACLGQDIVEQCGLPGGDDTAGHGTGQMTRAGWFPNGNY